MNRKLSIIFLVTLIIVGCSKKKVISKFYFAPNTVFEFQKINTKNIKNIEILNNGIEMRKPYKVTLGESYFPEIEKYKFHQPIVYFRDTSNITTIISYFFTEKDSLVRLIEYSWSKPQDNDSIISEIYTNNNKIIEAKFKIKSEVINESEDYWKQQTKIWENDSIYVKSFIFSSKTPDRTRVIIRQK